MDKQELLAIDNAWVKRIGKWLIKHNAPMGTLVIRLAIRDEQLGNSWGGVIAQAIQATQPKASLAKDGE